MKKVKKTRRYCPFCKKHTEQKISLISSGHARGSLKKGSAPRAKRRGSGVGTGNLGKWGSKPPITRWKRKTKSTKRINLLYTCEECKKSAIGKKGIRVSKLSLEEKKTK